MNSWAFRTNCSAFGMCGNWPPRFFQCANAFCTEVRFARELQFNRSQGANPNGSSRVIGLGT